MNKDVLRAEKVARWAEEDLEEAREFGKNATVEQQRIAREMARRAKRRHSRANRRAARAYCRDFDRH